MRRRSELSVWVSRITAWGQKKLLHGLPVGFYSLFSVTEEPWVTSGGKLALLLARSQRFHMH